MTKRTARNCAACGKDLYRKKVWEKRGKKVIGYCCAVTYTFRLDGSVRRRDDPNVLVAPKVESNLTLRAVDWAKAGEDRTVEATFENGEIVDVREIRPATNA